MRVFISFAHDDANLAAQLEAALRRNNIDTWSALDIAPGEDWTQAIDKKSASADGYVFLLGAGASENPQLRAEWRSLLRNDWESKKPLIPVILAHGGVAHDLPPFLRNRRAILTTNFDDAIREVRYLIEHPAEALDRTHEQESRAELEKRINELQDRKTDNNLKSAIAGETHEYTDMYPGMAKTARGEGFDEIADWFETLAKAEKSHAGRFQKALDSLGK